MTVSRRALAAFAVSVSALSVKSAEANVRPRAVVELFTSQGCSSCPPADHLLGQFAADRSLVALTYNVTIWDYLGWRDTLGAREHTDRQKAYAEARGDRRIYTPQALINGVHHAVGSDRREIESAMRRGATGMARHVLSVPVQISSRGSGYIATIGAWDRPDPLPATRLVAISVERERAVAIDRGENRGRAVTYHNIVRGLKDVAAWTGAAATVDLPATTEPGLDCAVLVQAVGETGRGPGAILGAAFFKA